MATRMARRPSCTGSRVASAASTFCTCKGLPNRPAGLHSSTSTMMMKIARLAARVEHLVSPSITPRPKPLTMAPMMEPMPPITTTANTTTTRFEPIMGLTW